MKKIGNLKKFGISIIGILVILILAFLILMPKSNADDNAIVYFECKNLKKALNKELRRSADSDITIKDMHGFTGRLYLGQLDITSMKGLEHLINLTELFLSENQISKIEGLDNLTDLTKLSLWRNKIRKIEGLDKLTNLTELNLCENQISKLEGLDNLTNLTELNLCLNQISKIEGLDNLTKLTKLDLGLNQISKLEGLDRLVNLTELDLWRNQISKIEGLDNLINLTGLHLFVNQISKVEGLDKLTKLKILQLDCQKIYLNINSNEFELPKIMYKNEEIEVKISDSFKNNITKIGENRYRIDDEGIKELKKWQEISQVICRWEKEIKEYRSTEKDEHTFFYGDFYAISKPKEKDIFNEEVVKNKCVKVGEKLDITTFLLNKPNGSRVEVVEDINTNTLGKKIGKIKIIFSDGSFKEIEVEVIVNTFNVQINYLDKKEKIVKSEEKEVKIDPEKLR